MEKGKARELTSRIGAVHIKKVLIESLGVMEAKHHGNMGYRRVPTGLFTLDARLGGLARGGIYIIGSRPGMGKTSLVLTMARYASIEAGKSVAVFSTEMETEGIAQRLLQSLASVDGLLFRQGTVNQEEGERIEEATGKLNQADLFLFDGQDITPDSILEKAGKVQQAHGLDLIVVDGLNVMAGVRENHPAGSLVDACAMALKRIAVKLEVPVLVTVALDYAVENRPDPWPRINDLPGDGLLEVVADVVILLNRFPGYEPVIAESEIIEIHLAKNRHGPTTHPQNPIRLVFAAPFVRFTDLP